MVWAKQLVYKTKTMQTAFSRKTRALKWTIMQKSKSKSNGEKKFTFQERYCLCNEPYNWAKLKSCNKICLIKWFHLDCVLLKTHPKGSWFCSTCKSTLTVKHVRIECKNWGSNWIILPLCWHNCSFCRLFATLLFSPIVFFGYIFIFCPHDSSSSWH